MARVNGPRRGTAVAALSVALALAAVSLAMVAPAPPEEEVSAAVEHLFRPLPFTPGEFGNASSTGAAMAADGSLSPQARAAAAAETRAQDAEAAAMLRTKVTPETRATLARWVAERTDRTAGEADRHVDQVLADLRVRAETRQAGRLKLALAAGLVVLMVGTAAAWRVSRA